MSDTIKPCPFCGFKDTKIYHDSDESVGFKAGYYLSRHAPCRISISGYFDTEQEAAHAWNARSYERRISEESADIAKELIEAADSLPWLPEDISDLLSRLERSIENSDHHGRSSSHSNP